MNRQQVLAAIGQTIDLADKVAGIAAQRFKLEAQVNHSALAAAVFGLRGRSGLRAVQAIAMQRVDDQASTSLEP